MADTVSGIICGIDPGSQFVGWALLDAGGQNPHLVASGVVRAKGGTRFGRYASIDWQLSRLFAKHKPEVVAFEVGFAGGREFQVSSMVLAEVRGIAMAAALRIGARIAEYAPASVKKAVTGHGQSDKETVRLYLERLFGLPAPPALDESDAIATALTHALRGEAEGG